jgi:choline monooxygenase
MGSEVAGLGVGGLGVGALRFVERRSYELRCNWKVFIDNYLDGGYHVPHIHKALGSVLDYSRYTIDTRERHCLQLSPVTSGGGGDSETASVRGGDRAYYYWLYPNFMLNWYEGVMDVNIALPLGVDRTLVLFDFYFAESASRADRDRNALSIRVAERIQQEDIDVCESVQRGLGSRAYGAGRLSVRREAGEQLFHRLLSADVSGASSK